MRQLLRHQAGFMRTYGHQSSCGQVKRAELFKSNAESDRETLYLHRCSIWYLTKFLKKFEVLGVDADMEQMLGRHSEAKG